MATTTVTVNGFVRAPGTPVTVGNIAVFDDTNGELIADGGSTLPIPVGQMVYVDQTYGSDSGPNIGLRGRFDRPFLTPEAAKVVALFGDLIHVGPGVYAITENLAKDGVNWYFEQGAVISMTNDDNLHIWDDGGNAVSFSVGGYGVFDRYDVTGGYDYASVLHMLNAGSNFNISCDSFGGELMADPYELSAAIIHKGGTLNLRARAINTRAGNSYYWTAGNAVLDISESIINLGNGEGDGQGVLTYPDEGNTDQVFINCPHIWAVKSGIYAKNPASHADTNGFRLWVNSLFIYGAVSGCQLRSGKSYITSQKIACGNGGVILDLGNVADGEQYVSVQKLGFADSVTDLQGTNAIVVASHSICRVWAQELDLSGIETQTSPGELIQISGSASINFELNGLVVKVPSVMTGAIIADSPSTTGRRAFKNCSFNNSLSGVDTITNASSDLELIGTTISTEVGSNSVSGSSVTFKSLGSRCDQPLGATVAAEGDLFYDDGTDPSGKVATGNANGSWSWAAPTGGGGAVDSVNGQTGTVSLDAADVGADPAGSAAAAQAAAIAASPAETVTTIGALINGATAKTTPVDADMIGLMDSAASNVLKKLSWANIKATLKTYFDTLYSPTALTIRTYSGTTDALVIGDAGNMVRGNNAAGNVITVPLNATVAFPIGSQVLVSQYGAGQTSFTPELGVTINSGGAALKIAIRYGCAVLTKTGTNEWNLEGNISS